MKLTIKSADEAHEMLRRYFSDHAYDRLRRGASLYISRNVAGRREVRHIKGELSDLTIPAFEALQAGGYIVKKQAEVRTRLDKTSWGLVPTWGLAESLRYPEIVFSEWDALEGMGLLLPEEVAAGRLLPHLLSTPEASR